MEEDRVQWHPIAKIQIAKDFAFMGPGCQELITLIQTFGSVRLACENMGLSYSKAWRMLNELELQTGFMVVTRKKGGRRGGETTLTPKGIELLNRYNTFEAECKVAIGQIFVRVFPNGAL